MKLCIHVRPRDDGQGWAVDVFDGRRAWTKTHLGESPLNKAEAHRLAHKLRDPKFYSARTKRAVRALGQHRVARGQGTYRATPAGAGGVVVLSCSLDRAVSERLRQERREGLPVSISFDECSTWASDFRGAVLRHYTGSKGAPVGKKQGWRIYEHVGRITNLIGWIGLGEPSYKLAPRRRLGLQDALQHDSDAWTGYRITDEGKKAIEAGGGR